MGDIVCWFCRLVGTFSVVFVEDSFEHFHLQGRKATVYIVVDTIMKECGDYSNGVRDIFGNVKNMLHGMIIAASAAHAFMDNDRHALQFSVSDIFVAPNWFKHSSKVTTRREM